MDRFASATQSMPGGSFPLDRARGLRRIIVDHPVDAPNLVDDPGRDPAEEGGIERVDIGRHPVGRSDRPKRADIFVGPVIAHHSDRPHRQQHGKGLPDCVVKPGIAYLVEKTGVPVLPVALIGTTEDFWQRARRGEKPPLEMRVGKPITLPLITTKGSVKHEARQQNADLVMSYLAGLLPEEYRGVYAGSAIISS